MKGQEHFIFLMPAEVDKGTKKQGQLLPSSWPKWGSGRSCRHKEV